MKVFLAAALLLACLFFQVVFSMKTKSPTCDEFAHHLANGYSYLVTGDFRMNPASPPLSRMLPALPLLFMGAKVPTDHWSWEKGDSPHFARQFFYQANPGSTERFVFWSRVPVAIVSIFFGLAVFLFSRKLFGDIAGLISLCLYAFSPNIIAHSGLATADLMVAFFFFLTLLSYRTYLLNPVPRWLILTGVAAGLTFLSKFSALLLLPCLLLIGTLSGKARWISPQRILTFGLVAALTIWAGYFFEIKPLLKNTPDPPKKIAMLQKIGGDPLVRFAQEVPIPLSTFSSAIVSMLFTRDKGCDAFLMGEWSRTGWWYYYFVALAIKETIPFLLLAILGILLFRSLKLDRVTAAVLLIPIGVIFILTLKDKAQAGIRYFLPIFPLLFILAGGIAAYLWRKGKVLKMMIVGLLGWHLAEAAMIYPHYLAYFNELIGGPTQGARYLRDSNIDWAQDLKGVGEWVREHRYPEVVLYCHGIEDPHAYGIPSRDFTLEEYVTPKKTVYAFGAHAMDSFLWAKNLKPTTVIGHSFYIYDLREKKDTKSS